MKKILLIIAILFCCSLLVAQRISTGKDKTTTVINENKKVYLGISFGPSIDWLSPTTSEFELSRNKTKGGFFVGVNVDVSVVQKRFLYFSTGLIGKFLQGELAFVNQYIFPDPITPKQLPTARTYQTMYLTIPTGIVFRTEPAKQCVFSGQIGLYHNFKVGGKQFDNFTLSSGDITLGTEYFITTNKIKNNDAALFAEAGYVGIGFEYEFAPKIRVFTNVNYSCQFGYFSSKAKNNISDQQFKAIVHSLYLVFGFMF